MADQQIEQSFKSVVDRTWQLLKPHGFRKQGQRFRRHDDETVAIVEFQRSHSSDHGTIQFTMNLGVVSAALARCIDPERDVRKAVASDAHLSERIGFLLPSAQDYWWLVTAATDSEALAEEVASAVENIVLPYLDHLKGDDRLLELWKSGKSPGLTAGQRQRYWTLLAS